MNESKTENKFINQNSSITMTMALNTNDQKT